MCLCVLSISTICIVTNGCKSYSFIVTLLKLWEILYGRSQRKEKKSWDQMGKVCLDLKVDLERIVFFQIRKLQIVATTSTTINHHAKELIIVILEGQVDKTSLHAWRRSSFFARISRKHTSTIMCHVSFHINAITNQ